MTNRRTFLTVLASGLLAAPLAAEGQGAERNYRIGFLSTQTSSQTSSTLNLPLTAFKHKLRDLGYVEGRNLVIEYRWAGASTSGFLPWRGNWCASRWTSS